MIKKIANYKRKYKKEKKGEKNIVDFCISKMCADDFENLYTIPT